MLFPTYMTFLLWITESHKYLHCTPLTKNQTHLKHSSKYFGCIPTEERKSYRFGMT